MAKDQQYIVLPPRGLRAQSGEVEVGTFLRALSARMNVKAASKSIPGVNVRVIDSIADNGAKLVEMQPNELSNLRANSPGVRVVPVKYFTVARNPIPHPVKGPKKLGANVSTAPAVKVVSAADGSPVSGAKVVAFTNFATREGAEGNTNAQGVVRLSMGIESGEDARIRTSIRGPGCPSLIDSIRDAIHPPLPWGRIASRRRSGPHPGDTRNPGG